MQLVLLHSLSTGSRRAAALAMWALWAALVSMPQCGMALIMLIRALHLQQVLRWARWAPLQQDRITMRLRRAAITLTHLATETTRRGGN